MQRPPRMFFLLRSKKIVTLICFFLRLTCLGQEAFLQKITSSLHQYERWEQPEKIYLQTDKSFYLAGEICWFKSYTVEGVNHRPFSLSKVAYVELLNNQDKPVLQGKISLLQGFGDGSFFLPLSLPSGSYKIRAYTNWMKNAGPAYFFKKDLTIVNTLKSGMSSAIQIPPTVDLQFFPEGGNLIAGVPNVVGFKATDEKGAGVQIEGDIVDQDNTPLVHFKSQVFGMGRFVLKPVAGKMYKAYIKIGQSQLTVVNLPAVLPKGYTLDVKSATDNRITVSVFSKDEEDSRPLYLLIHTRGQVRYTQALTLVGGTATLSINKNLLGEGISCITLFDSQQQPIGERLYFRLPAKLDLSAKSDQEEYSTRQQITTYLRLNSGLSDSTMVHLGLSVYKTDSLQTEAASDIRSWLYLNSDIRGVIEQPEYYFSHTGEDVETAMDNLMLTQGWRRFTWQDVSANKPPAFEYIPEWAGHLVSGKVTDKITGQPLNNISVNLAGPAVKSQLANSVSNKSGQLLFDFPSLTGSNLLVMQTEYIADSNYKLDISSPFSEKYFNSPFLPFKLSQHFADELTTYNVASQVENVYFLNQLLKFKTPQYRDTTTFYGQPDKMFLLDDYTRFNTMEEVIREYVTGIAVRKRHDKFSFRILDESTMLYFDQDPLILLDGVPVFDATEIMSLDPLKIKKLEIVNRKYFLGSLVANGIIALYSYNNDMAGLQMTSNGLIFEYEGLQLEREFYTPKYNLASPDQKRIPDFRNVLVWDPNIVIGKKGEAQINFYSSDLKGRYVGVVEGLDQNGNCGSTHFYFEVQ